jgi:hypothetical protein
MHQGLSVTRANFTRWEEAFMLMAMERCQPFFAEMGLPPEICAAPQPLALCARSFLEKSYAAKSGEFNSSADYVETVRDSLESALAQVSMDYGEATARAFQDWCMRYVVDQSMVTKLDVWEPLFRRLCGLVADDGMSAAPPRNHVDLVRICEIVYQHLSPGSLKEIQQRLEAARRFQLSETEKWIDETIRYFAGQGEVSGAISIALNIVEAIISRYRIFRLWDYLNSISTPREISSLLEWGRQQALALGMPVDAFDSRPI